MRRGTTPTHNITTELDLTDAEVIFLTYKQNKKKVLDLDKSRMTITSESISVELTQEETLMFNDQLDATAQIRARFSDERAVASNVMIIPINEILKDGVI